MVVGTTTAFAQTVTGCLTNGTLKKIALGNAPASPCSSNQIQVTLGAKGDTGGTGATGPDGPEGPEGPEGPAGGGAAASSFEFIGYSTSNTVTGSSG